MDRDLKCDALIIGGGISGALLANRMVNEGIDCVLIDRRHVGFGSTSASTALLQYEIDTPLHQLQKKVGPTAAERAYRAGIESIDRLQRLAGEDCGFALRQSLHLATREKDVKSLETEYHLRRTLKFSVALLSRSDLRERGIEGAGALRSKIAAEVDQYRLTHRLLRLALRKGLRVFDRTTALSYDHSRNGVTVKTDRGYQIRRRTVFFASATKRWKFCPRRLLPSRALTL